MKKSIRVIVSIILLAVLALFLRSHDSVSVERILDWVPPNLFLAAIVLLAAYAVKCVVVVIPMILLQTLVGHLFTHGQALLINSLGLVICMTLPYWLGQKRGASLIEKLVKRYPGIGEVMHRKLDDKPFLIMILRAIPILPGDILTMYLGATKVPFKNCMIGGILGSLPTMVLATFLGQSIRDPGSPSFWWAVGLNIAWVALSGVGYWIFNHFK